MRILIADDDKNCRDILNHILTPHGSVTVTFDGIGAVAEVARALAAHQPYDLICLDIMMPGIDGQTCLDVIRRLEQLNGKLTGGAQVAMVSALDSKEQVFSAFRNQADLYFTKPLDFAHMLRELRRVGVLGEASST